MTKYIFDNYEDNLDDNKLASVPSEKLIDVVFDSDCYRIHICEVCRAYLSELFRRLRRDG